MYKNSLQFKGRLTSDPEMRFTNNGTPVCSFDVAANKPKKNDDGTWDSIPVYASFVAWGKDAETINRNFVKGDLIAIDDAEMQTRSWDDNDGKKRYKTEFVVRSFDKLAPLSYASEQTASVKKPATQPQSRPVPARPQATKSSLNDDDMPF